MMAGVLLAACRADSALARPSASSRGRLSSGFTNGIAVLIASTQIKDFFGLQIDHVPGEFLQRMETLAAHAGTWSPAATALAGGSLLVMLLVDALVAEDSAPTSWRSWAAPLP